MHDAPIASSSPIRLFPLPNLVFFPHVMQPLHTFEPRYRQMTADALAADRKIALTLLQPGWQEDYEGKPAIYPIATLGTIVSDHRLEDGRYNLLLQGTHRIRVREEVPSDKLYRLANVELLSDYEVESADRAVYWRTLLQTEAPKWFQGQADAIDQFRKLLQGKLPLGTLADIIAFALPLEVEFKRSLLEQLCVETRLQWISQRLGNKKRSFPPPFSVN